MSLDIYQDRVAIPDPFHLSVFRGSLRWKAGQRQMVGNGVCVWLAVAVGDGVWDNGGVSLDAGVDKNNVLLNTGV